MTVQYFLLFFLLLYQTVIAISFYLATFRNGLPKNRQIHRSNRNALVSLSNGDITREKVEINITFNSHTIFLVPTNATVDVMNNHVLNVLFSTQITLIVVTNGLHSQMPVYRSMTVIITENRLVNKLLFLLVIYT